MEFLILKDMLLMKNIEFDYEVDFFLLLDEKNFFDD